MKCLKCDCDVFNEEICKFNPEIKGEEFKVEANAMVCEKCSSILMTTEQMDKLRKLVEEQRSNNERI